MPELEIPDYPVSEDNRHPQKQNRPGGEENVVDKLDRENILMRNRCGYQVRCFPGSIKGGDGGHDIRYDEHDKYRQKSQGDNLVYQKQPDILQTAEIIEYPVKEKEAAPEKT
jgi:hypothetical protein